MRITSTQVISGIPAVTLRDHLRTLVRTSFSAAVLADRFRTDADDPVASVASLLAEGYVERHDEPTGAQYRLGDGRDEEIDRELGLQPEGTVGLVLTTLGLALANATAAKPVKRSTAKRALDEFLERVAQVHADDDLAFDVAKVVLFGSYLDRASDVVGDVDLALELVRRPLSPGESEQEQRQRRIKAARYAGRQFRGILDELYWPEQEVLLKLKGRSRVLSFVDYRQHEEFFSAVPHEIIYQQP